jgi:hypothetical protein
MSTIFLENGRDPVRFPYGEVVHFRYTGNGQNIGTTMQYKNETVLVSLNEHY